LNPSISIPFSLASKAAIVTGGGSGIGLAIARRFREQGAAVLIADRRRDGQEVAEEIGAAFHRTDVSDESDVAEMFAAAKRLFGTIHILMNSPGRCSIGPLP